MEQEMKVFNLHIGWHFAPTTTTTTSGHEIKKRDILSFVELCVRKKREYDIKTVNNEKSTLTSRASEQNFCSCYLIWILFIPQTNKQSKMVSMQTKESFLAQKSQNCMRIKRERRKLMLLCVHSSSRIYHSWPQPDGAASTHTHLVTNTNGKRMESLLVLVTK